MAEKRIKKSTQGLTEREKLIRKSKLNKEPNHSKILLIVVILFALITILLCLKKSMIFGR